MRTGLSLCALVLTIQRIDLSLGLELGVDAARDRGGEQLVAGAELGEVATTLSTSVATRTPATRLLRDNAGELCNVAIKIPHLRLYPRCVIQKETVRIDRGHAATLAKAKRLTVHRERSAAAAALLTGSATLSRSTALLGPSPRPTVAKTLFACHST